MGSLNVCPVVARSCGSIFGALAMVCVMMMGCGDDPSSESYAQEMDFEASGAETSAEDDTSAERAPLTWETIPEEVKERVHAAYSEAEWDRLQPAIQQDVIYRMELMPPPDPNEAASAQQFREEVEQYQRDREAYESVTGIPASWQSQYPWLRQPATQVKKQMEQDSPLEVAFEGAKLEKQRLDRLLRQRKLSQERQLEIEQRLQVLERDALQIQVTWKENRDRLDTLLERSSRAFQAGDEQTALALTEQIMAMAPELRHEDLARILSRW